MTAEDGDLSVTECKEVLLALVSSLEVLNVRGWPVVRMDTALYSAYAKANDLIDRKPVH